MRNLQQLIYGDDGGDTQILVIMDKVGCGASAGINHKRAGFRVPRRNANKCDDLALEKPNLVAVRTTALRTPRTTDASNESDHFDFRFLLERTSPIVRSTPVHKIRSRRIKMIVE
ncbi:hypothetical protein TcasGA2_TC001216 [Tribolium castaneum]|uniref:Uncharacterized protein n=1 Tax=Tribolium castaneum TaxID=7070 RepID=D6WAT5_TRICA|nr:hypothetical protein TcasGA2_TC001216 [Tribolium castaneum]